MGSCNATQGAQPSTQRPPRGVGWGVRREDQEGGNIYMHTHLHTHTLMADLHYCMAETNTTL